jgi:uncharacterized protein
MFDRQIDGRIFDAVSDAITNRKEDDPPFAIYTHRGPVPQLSASPWHFFLSRCAQASLVTFLVVTLESCSSAPRTKASSSSNSSKVVLANDRSNTGALPIRSNFMPRTLPPALVDAHVPAQMVAARNDRRPNTSLPGFGLRSPSWIGLVSHEANGTFARVAADLHDGLAKDGIQISLSGTENPMQTLHDIMHKPGADVGLVQADALESLVLSTPSTDARQRLRYIARAYEEYVHLIAREQITSVRQVNGLRVNIGKPGSPSDLTARLLFSRLGINAFFTNLEPTEALDRLRSGDLDAVFILAPRPAGEILSFEPDRFHLLDVPWEPEIGSAYQGVELQADDYPLLIKEGEHVRTVAVGVLFAVFNWPKGSRGFERLERFAKSLSSRLVQAPGPERFYSWDKVDFNADVYGWERFQPGPAQHSAKELQHRRTPTDHPGRPSDRE